MKSELFIDVERKIDNETAKKQILEYEAMADFWLATGEISQEAAWDMYFGLMHECDERHFTEDFKRIVKKIDVKKYNPFKSLMPEVAFLARLRAQRMGLTYERN